MNDPFLFAVAVLAILATPGPTNTLLATAGATRGFVRSMPLLVAEAAGYTTTIVVVHTLAAALGWDSGKLGAPLRLIAGGYLMWLAIKLWRTPFVKGQTVVLPRHVLTATLMNPKALIFALAIIPFDAPHAPVYVVGFWLLLLSMGSAWLAGGAILRRSAGRYSNAFPRVASLVLATLSTVLMVSPLLW